MILFQPSHDCLLFLLLQFLMIPRLLLCFLLVNYQNLVISEFAIRYEEIPLGSGVWANVHYSYLFIQS
jgi:hypothetical protein